MKTALVHKDENLKAQQDLNIEFIELCGKENVSIEEVEESFENVSNINAVDSFGCTALNHAIVNNNIDIVKFLILKNADIEARDKRGNTPLGWAVKAENLKLINYLLENGANPLAVNESGCSILTTACLFFNLDVVDRIKEAIARKLNENLLAELIKLGQRQEVDISYIKSLLEQGANPNYKDRNGDTALHWAASCESKNSLEIIDLLLEYGADIEASGEHGATPLFKAVSSYKCSSSFIDIIKFLVQRGANIDVKLDYGWHLLSELGEGGSLYTQLKTIMDKGANCTKEEIIDILFPLDEKSSSTRINEDVPTLNEELINLFDEDSKATPADVASLLEQGADVNYKDKYSEATALHHAASKENIDNNIESAKLLLAQGADVNAGDKQNNTPLAWAVQANNLKFINYLLEKGANPLAVNDGDYSIIRKAYIFSNVLVIDRIKEAIKNYVPKAEKEIRSSEEGEKIIENESSIKLDSEIKKEAYLTEHSDIKTKKAFDLVNTRTNILSKSLSKGSSEQELSYSSDNNVSYDNTESILGKDKDYKEEEVINKNNQSQNNAVVECKVEKVQDFLINGAKIDPNDREVIKYLMQNIKSLKCRNKEHEQDNDNAKRYNKILSIIEKHNSWSWYFNVKHIGKVICNLFSKQKQNENSEQENTVIDIKKSYNYSFCAEDRIASRFAEKVLQHKINKPERSLG